MENPIESINKVLLEIIHSKGKDTNSIKLEKASHLSNDLGFTSIDMAQMIVELQEHFNYDPLSQGVLLSEIATIGDLYKIFVPDHVLYNQIENA